MQWSGNHPQHPSLRWQVFDESIIRRDVIALLCLFGFSPLSALEQASTSELWDTYFDSQQMVKCKQCVTGQKIKQASENSRVHPDCLREWLWFQPMSSLRVYQMTHTSLYMSSSPQHAVVKLQKHTPAGCFSFWLMKNPLFAEGHFIYT